MATTVRTKIVLLIIETIFIIILIIVYIHSDYNHQGSHKTFHQLQGLRFSDRVVERASCTRADILQMSRGLWQVLVFLGSSTDNKRKHEANLLMRWKRLGMRGNPESEGRQTGECSA